MNQGHQTIILSVRRQMPAVGFQRHQRVVLLRDGSPSMEGKKAREADAASTECTGILACRGNRDAFYVAVVDFGGRADVAHPFDKASALDGRLHRLEVGVHGTGTNIGAALDCAQELLSQHKPVQGNFAEDVVLLLSDGENTEGPDPVPSADELKHGALVVCVGFGDDVDMPTLRRIATSPQHCVRCASGDELRQFFAQVGVTLTQTLTAGTNATQALAQQR